MPNYVHTLFGYYLNMLLLVLHCTLNLLVSTRGSRVLDAYNQAVEKNKYCSKIAECQPGTHVMCMYNTDKISPRCADGKILPLYHTEKDLFLDIFNGFRRDLASGKEILGKDNVRLPQALNMRKLFWDNDLATFAQAWANQCHVQRNMCHSTDQYPRAGQMVGIVRFSYPDWTVPNQKFIDSGLSLERRKFAIEDFAKTIFSARKSVTLSMIQENVGSGHGNVYLMSVYGSTSHIGCAMTAFVDYQMSFDPISDYYNSLILVCNFGSRPQNDEPIYMTNGTGPCSCFQGFKIENCLCVPGEDNRASEPNEITERPDHKDELDHKEEGDDKAEKPDQKEETENPNLDDRTTEKPTQNEVTTEKPNQNETTEKPEEKKEDPDKNGHKGNCPAISPVVVVLPIIDVHDAALIQQLGPFQNQNSTKIIAQRRQQFRNKIKERIQNAKEQYFCSHGEPVPHVFNAGAVAQDSFLKTEFDPEYKISNGNRKERDLDLSIPRNLHNIRIKPKLDVSDINAQRFHKHQNNIKGNSRTNVAHRLFNDMNTAADKVYVPTVKRKKYQFENFHNNRMLNRPLPYGVQGLSNQKPNVFISSINGKPVKLRYDDEFKKSLQPSRDLSYDDKGFNYKKIPYMAILNDDHDQSISDMYAEEQELKEIWHDTYIDELLRQILGTTGEKIMNKDNILINKQTGKDDLTKSISSEVFGTGNINPSNIDKKEECVKTIIDIWPTRNEMMHTNLNLNGNLQTQESNRIFNDMRHSAVSKVHATSVKGGLPVLHPLENIQKSQRLNTGTFPYHAEPEIDMTPINGETKKHLQSPGTRILSYDVNDEILPFTISNNNCKHLLSGLFEEEELKDILYNNYITEMGHKNGRNTVDDITNKENIVITKQIDSLTDNHRPKVHAANNIDPSNIFNEHKTIDMAIGNCPIKNKNQNGDISRTEEENRMFNNMRNTETTKVYVALVNANPVNYSFEKFQKYLKQDNKISPYDEQGISNREPKIDITNDKSKPVKYHYDYKNKKSQNPSITKFSHDVGGSIYKKSPYTTMSNDNLDQLLVDLYNEEQELKDILLKNYITQMEQENLATTGKEYTNRDITLTNKQSGKGAKSIVSKVFPAVNNNPPNKHNTMKTQINDWPTRNQVPLHIHAYGTDNFDYNRHFHATHDFIKPRAILRNNKNSKDASNGYNPERHRLEDYDLDKLRNYFLDMLKDRQ